MEKKSRLRAPNFTNSDSLLLCDIILKYRHIIENKKTDGANLVQKQRAWLDVQKEFNCNTCGYSRTVESLQQNYKNLKKKAKKNVSGAKMDIPVDKAALISNIEEFGTSSVGWQQVANSTGASEEVCQEMFAVLGQEAKKQERILKKSVMGTGGGPPPRGDDDPLLDKVKALVGPSMEGLYTIYDGDSSIMELQNTPPIEVMNSISFKYPEELSSQLKNENTVEPTQGSNSTCVSVMTPKTHVPHDEDGFLFTNDRANLKKKPHDLLSRKRRLETQIPPKQTVADKFKNLAEEKMELVDLQKELLKTQLLEEKEKLEHNRLLRAIELDDARAKYAHNEKMRKIELDRTLHNKA